MAGFGWAVDNNVSGHMLEELLLKDVVLQSSCGQLQPRVGISAVHDQRGVKHTQHIHKVYMELQEGLSSEEMLHPSTVACLFWSYDWKK